MNLKRIVSLITVPLFVFAWKMESGSVTLPATTAGSSTWQTITLKQTYDTTPLVFALVDQGSGHPADTPVIVRVRNVTTSSFEMVQVEAQSIAELVADRGPHPSVNVHYLVIEPGDHTLADGTRILAGVHNTTTKQGRYTPNPKGFDTITLSPAFTTVPIVLGMVQGVANETSILPGETSSPWLTQTIRNVTTSSFQLALERAETSTGDINTAENIAYLVMESGRQTTLYDTNTCRALQLETIRTADSIRGWQNGCYTYNFANTYTLSPNVIGVQNTRDGGDGGWLRRCSLGTTSVGITIDEDQASDNERAHTTERAGLLIFEQDFVFDSQKMLSCGLEVEYRMDECYWLNGAGGVIGDVKEASSNQYDATSEQTASIDKITRQICHAGSFRVTNDRVSTDNATVLGNLTNQVSVSAWLYPTAFTQWSSALQKVSNDNWNDGFGLIHNNNDGTNITFYINAALSGTGRVSAPLDMNTWNHIVGVYDGTEVQIYKNGTLVTTSAYSTNIINSAQPLTIGNDFLGSFDDVWQGNIDEVKVWRRALSASEINTIYTNELAGNNYDGTPRVCPTCDTTAQAGIWGLIGIPADFRSAANKDVADVFDEFPAASYNVSANADGWVLFQRDYSTTDNSSSYSIVPYTGSPLKFGQGYWLISKTTQAWSENGMPPVDYNSTDPNCVSATCIEIDLTPVTLNFGAPDNDPNDGSGANRNNMLGFVGNTPVDWADCRIVVDGVAYTPSGAEAAGFSEKQVWQYNPGVNGANANGYTTCDDTTPGGCKLEPYRGFWLILYGKTKGKTVKLLIPKE